jgi:hypothetical protein
MSTPTYTRPPVHTKVRKRFYIPFLMGLIMLMIGLYDSGTHQMPVWQVLAWFIGGALIGLLFGKLTKVKWDTNKELIIFEEGQGIVMGIYIVVRIIGELVIHQTMGETIYFIDTILLFAAGSLMGRSIGIARNVREEIV